MKLHERLQGLRKLKGVTQADAAAGMELSQEHLNRLERGAVLPSLTMLKAIASYYSTSPAKLLQGLEFWDDDNSVL